MDTPSTNSSDPLQPSPSTRPPLEKTHCAVFRATSRDLTSVSPEKFSQPEEVVIQEQVIIPLNAMMGRHQLGQANAGLAVDAPGIAISNYFVQSVDYFDNVYCSGLHCFVEVDHKGQIRIRDNNSTNGTWLLASSKSWQRLPAGRSHRLEMGQRIRLGGQNSKYEYEYMGLSSHAHIRIRHCSKNNDALIDTHHWEWMKIPADGQVWSTRELRNPAGVPLHGGPHFEVCVTRNSNGLLQAQIDYERVGNRLPLRFIQTEGSSIYGAELWGLDEDWESENYQVGYELLLPGEIRGMITPIVGKEVERSCRHFAYTESLRFDAQLDEEGWASHAHIVLTSLAMLGYYGTEIKFYGVRNIAAANQPARLTPAEIPPNGMYSKTAKSIRQAITCGLIELRRRDQECPDQAPGWMIPDDIVGLTQFRELSAEKFLSNFKKWRSDIRDQLLMTSTNAQGTLPKYIAIPYEQDWLNFVELETRGETIQVRLHPKIRVEIDKVQMDG